MYAYNPRMMLARVPCPIVLQDHGGALFTENLAVNIFYLLRPLRPAQLTVLPAICWPVHGIRAAGARLRLDGSSSTSACRSACPSRF
jgi:hypothetical protein